LDEQGAQTPVETKRGEEAVAASEPVETEHEAALACVVLELAPAQVDACHVARGARALDGERGRLGEERLGPGLENLRSQEEPSQVLGSVGASDVDARGGEGVAVPGRARGDSERLAQRGGAQRVQERQRQRAEERHRQSRVAAAEREEDLGAGSEVHRGERAKTLSSARSTSPAS